MTRRLTPHGDTHILWAANPGASRAYRLITAITGYEGVSLLWGAPERTTSPAYATIHQVGGPVLFGWVLTAAAALLILAPMVSLRWTRFALLTGCALHVLIALSFTDAATDSSFAGILGLGWFWGGAAWFISQAELYRTRRT